MQRFAGIRQLAILLYIGIFENTNLESMYLIFLIQIVKTKKKTANEDNKNWQF